MCDNYLKCKNNNKKLSVHVFQVESSIMDRTEKEDEKIPIVYQIWEFYCIIGEEVIITVHRKLNRK